MAGDLLQPLAGCVRSSGGRVRTGERSFFVVVTHHVAILRLLEPSMGYVVVPHIVDGGL